MNVILLLAVVAVGFTASALGLLLAELAAKTGEPSALDDNVPLVALGYAAAFLLFILVVRLFLRFLNRRPKVIRPDKPVSDIFSLVQIRPQFSFEEGMEVKIDSVGLSTERTSIGWDDVEKTGWKDLVVDTALWLQLKDGRQYLILPASLQTIRDYWPTLYASRSYSGNILTQNLKINRFLSDAGGFIENENHKLRDSTETFLISALKFCLTVPLIAPVVGYLILAKPSVAFMIVIIAVALLILVALLGPGNRLAYRLHKELRKAP